jgi:hypothetical protein
MVTLENTRLFWRKHKTQNTTYTDTTTNKMSRATLPIIFIFGRRVHNYDLKKKVQSSVAVGRNDNYDLKKKVQSSGVFINTSGKKRLSHLAVSGNVWGVPRAQMFRWVHNYDLKKINIQSSGLW